MSETASRGRQAGLHAEGLTAPAARRLRGSWRWLVLGTVVLVAAGIAAGWRTGALTAAASRGAGGLGATPPATAPVMREDIAATTPVAATLGYAGSWTVTGQGGGTLTSLPQPGQVISQGQVLYETGNGSPVVLLYGRVPDWRAMSEGTAGADVSQLNHDLVALGDADAVNVATAGWDYFSAATAYGLQQLDLHLGISSAPASLSLGQVVFEPEAIRVATLIASLGGPVSGPVLTATSDEHVVMIDLDTSQESEVRAGDTVTITLPDGTTTTGVISAVGTVATTSQSQAGGTVTTVPVTVRLTDPTAAGSLDQAPVTVNITTATARDVLAVPVTALLAQAPGRYLVEVAVRGNIRRYVPVTTGIFDGASGMVQVTGNLTPGQRVVVASS